jgi:hypothetical protein
VLQTSGIGFVIKMHMMTRWYRLTKRHAKELITVRQVTARKPNNTVAVVLPDCLTRYDVEAAAFHLHDTCMYVLQ